MYSKIDSRFWGDEKVVKFPAEEKYLLLYLLTCSHRNVIGCYRLPKSYIITDTGLTEKRFNIAWKRLLDCGIISYDSTTNMVFVKNFLIYNPIEGSKQVTGAISRLEGLPRSKIYSPLITVLKSLQKDYLQPIIVWLSDKLPETVSDTPPDTLCDTLCDRVSGTVEETVSDTPPDTSNSNSKQYKVTVDSNSSNNGGGIDNSNNAHAREKTAAAVAAYEQNIAPITKMIFDKLDDWLNDVDLSLVEYAIEEAVMCNKRNWSYINAIINNHFTSGRTTRVEAEQYQGHKQKGAGGKPNTLGVLADIIAEEEGGVIDQS